MVWGSSAEESYCAAGGSMSRRAKKWSVDSAVQEAPYQGGPDIRLAPSNSLPFYPPGQAGQHDICLLKERKIGRFDEPRM